MAFLKDVQSTDFTRNSELRYLQYKNYSFLYGPQKITTSEDSRLAEYKYLFINGSDYTKLRGATRVVLEGVLIAGPLNEETVGKVDAKKSESFQIMQKFISLANNSPGPLILPEHGRYENALIVDWEFSEDGEYNKELEFRLEFVILNIVPSVDRVAPIDQKTQYDLPDEEKTNFCYTVMSGDTLSGIASRFGVTLSLIKAQHPELFDARHRGGNLIFPGEQICLKKGSALAERPSVPSGTSTIRNVKNSSDIPKDARLNTYIENKNLECRAVGVPVGIVGSFISGFTSVVSKGIESYSGMQPGDTINQSKSTPASSTGFTPIPRNETTQDLYQSVINQNEYNAYLDSVRNQQDAEAKRSEFLSNVIKTTAEGRLKQEVFPAFKGVVQYPKDRINKASSVQPAILDGLKKIIGTAHF